LRNIETFPTLGTIRVMDVKKAWDAVLGDIELQVSRPNFLTWLKNSELVEQNEKAGVVTVALPNTFTKEWVKNKYHKLILHALRDIDSTIKNVDYVVLNKTGVPRSVAPAAAASTAQSSLLEVNLDPQTNLNPKYSLSSFIVGSSNELAHAAAQAVVEHIGTRYNPLFIYGKVGLGKTHLIQGVGNEIKEKHASRVNVLYTTSENFIRDVVQAIRHKRVEDMKKKYRRVDVLIIDDIQFIGGKSATEIEFFHTFNALHEQNKQIILSSDRPPAAIAELEERLRSRFEGGMIADISYPDYETRLAILRAKRELRGVHIEDWILEYAAQTIQDNIRELEGVLNKIVFYQNHKGETIDRKFLEKIIGETSRASSIHVTPDKIIKIVARFFDITSQDLTRRTRKRDVVEPRQICMYLMRDILKLSYPYIGEHLGKRDHTTVIHACEKVGDDVRNKPGINQKIMLLKEQLYQS